MQVTAGKGRKSGRCNIDIEGGGSATLDAAGFVSVSATLAGVVELKNCKLGPFHVESVNLGITFTASVTVIFVVFKITIKFTLGGGITVSTSVYIKWVGKPFAGYGNSGSAQR